MNKTAFQILEGTIKGWLYTLGLLYLLILVASTRSARVNFFQQNCTALQKPHRAHALNLKNVDANTLGFLCLSVIIVGYHFYVGPYTEIPSDFWEHLARAEFGLLSIRETLDQPLKLRNLGAIAQPDVIYWGHGLAALPYSASALNAAPGATLALSIIFLGSVYWFSISLVSQGHYSSGLARCSVGLLTALLTAISFGTSTFSYFRYYAYFPTIFCFPIVFLCVQLLVDYQNHPRGNVSNIIGIPFFFAVICLVHIQEFLFALILVYGLIFWRAAEAFFFPRTNDVSKARVHYLIATICVLLLGAAALLLLRSFCSPSCFWRVSTCLSAFWSSAASAGGFPVGGCSGMATGKPEGRPAQVPLPLFRRDSCQDDDFFRRPHCLAQVPEWVVLP